MDNRDDKELLKKLAKKIKTKVKASPLKIKIIIIAAIIILIFFFVAVVLIMAMSIFFFLDFDGGGSGGGSNGTSDFTYIQNNSQDNYWWPIGGNQVVENNGVKYAIGTPTATAISSQFNPNRVITDSNGNQISSPHYAVDITGDGTHYIIAVANGKVYDVATGCDNSGSIGNYCNGGLGNYVVIDHLNGNYTVYGHMAPNTVTVSKNDIVNQGEIIGVMGNSGNSSGQHLHFQLEIGGRGGATYGTNPLNYISSSDPRPITIQSESSTNLGGEIETTEFVAMLQSWEGTGQTSGDHYIVYPDSGGVLTVGHGVTLVNNADKFRKYNINVSNLGTGSLVKKSIVDTIENEILSEKRASIISMLNNNGITLEEYQIDALVIRMYNVGNVGGFPSKYKQYGNTEELNDYYMNSPVTDTDGNYLLGLDRRRQAEWKLFHEGIYTLNS